VNGGDDNLKFALERVTDLTAVEKLEPEMDELFGRLRNPNPYLSTKWMFTWWKHFGNGKQPVVLVVRDAAGAMRAYWPFIEVSGVGCSGLWPWVNNHANYSDPVADEEAPGCVELLLDGYHGLLEDYHFVWFPFLRETFWRRWLEPFLRDKPEPRIERIARQVPIAVFPDSDFDAYWRTRQGAKSRKTFRYVERKLRERGEVRFVDCESEKEMRTHLGALCDLESRGWKQHEKVGLFSSKGARAFLFDLLPALAAVGRMRLTFLFLDDEAIASELGVLGKNTYGLHHLAYDEAYDCDSPGRQLLARNLRRCCEEGRRIFDFLPGANRYKRELATEETTVRELHLFRRSLPGFLTRKSIEMNLRRRRKKRLARGVQSRADRNAAEVLLD
jgi:CelD/BcsL family acetyltransferase involved in cellulose biosynthesis